MAHFHKAAVGDHARQYTNRNDETRFCERLWIGAHVKTQHVGSRQRSAQEPESRNGGATASEGPDNHCPATNVSQRHENPDDKAQCQQPKGKSLFQNGRAKRKTSDWEWAYEKATQEKYARK
jgi:hypothetical protein